jgi:hypothetical protein
MVQEKGRKENLFQREGKEVGEGREREKKKGKKQKVKQRKEKPGQEKDSRGKSA